MEILVFAPHIDDAILSMGGVFIRLMGARKHIKVYYVFSRSSWINPDAINNQNTSINVDEITNLRKHEEMRVSSEMGYQCNFFDFPDYPLRLSYSRAEEDQMTEEIKQLLKKIAGGNQLIFFPLGITHPDHLITGKIGRWMIEAGYDVLFYEDLPYIAVNGAILKSTVHALKSSKFGNSTFDIDLAEKLRLLEGYQSQISEEWLRIIEQHSMGILSGRTLERIWGYSKALMLLNSLICIS